MKRLILFICLILGIIYSSNAQCYLWGNVSEDLQSSSYEWKYVQLQETETPQIYTGKVKINGRFYVTITDMIDMTSAAFNTQMQLWGFVPKRAYYDEYFIYGYALMSRCSEVNTTDWLIFSPTPGIYEVEVDLRRGIDTMWILASSDDSGIPTTVNDIIEDKTSKIYDLNGNVIRDLDNYKGIYFIKYKGAYIKRVK